MCKHENEKRIENEAHESTRRLVALSALAQLDAVARDIADIRTAFDAIRQQHERNGKELDATEQLIERMEDQIIDEAMDTASLEDEAGVDDAEHDCECMGREEEADSAQPTSYDDEEHEHVGTGQDGSSDIPLRRSRGRRAGFVPLVFGALGVACAVASLVARRLADENE
jgi:hypothetical protein